MWLSIAADRVLYDSSCAYSDNYEFSLFEKTLANRGCPAQAFDYLVHLTDEQVARLEAILTSVYNTCEKLCGFPHERASITVRNETTGAQATFNRNFDFFHDCSESGVGNPFPPGPPFIGFSDFSELQTALAQIIAEACRPGDSGPPDAGRCVNRSDGGSEAGPSDAAAQAPEGDATLDHAGDLGMTTPVADTQIILYDNVVVASERTGCKVP